MSGKDEPRPVGDALRRVRRELGTPEPGELEAVRTAWPELVGASLAAHSEPLFLRAGVLRVAVDDPAWAGQFRYLGDQLVAALVARAPNAAIREVSVTVSHPADPDPTSSPGRSRGADGIR